MFRLGRSAQRVVRGSSSSSSKALNLSRVGAGVSARWLEYPEYHPKDLRYNFMTEEEAMAVSFDNFATAPFSADRYPGFSATPDATTSFFSPDDELKAYTLQKLADIDDPGMCVCVCVYVYVCDNISRANTNITI